MKYDHPTYIDLPVVGVPPLAVNVIHGVVVALDLEVAGQWRALAAGYGANSVGHWATAAHRTPAAGPRAAPRVATPLVKRIVSVLVL